MPTLALQILLSTNDQAFARKIGMHHFKEIAFIEEPHLDRLIFDQQLDCLMA